MDEKYNEIKKVIDQYFLARKTLFELELKYPNELSGNDNIIGRIGEYIALRFLETKGREVIKNRSRTEKGYDLVDTKSGSKISVKIITTENKGGSSTRLKQPWDEVVFILLDKNYEIHKIGLLTKKQFNDALSAKSITSSEPIIRRSMLGKKGLFRYGIVEDLVKKIL